jgi:hypothetical protein
MRSRAAVLAALIVGLSLRPALGEIIDRIVAVVDNRPVFLSEVRAVQQVRGTDDSVAREALIDEILMYAEARRYLPARPTRDEEERARASLEQPPAEAQTEDALLKAIARRQATILKYVQLRFAPLVHVEDTDVTRAYDARWANDPLAPPLTQVRADLIAEITRGRLDARIESWVDQLRAVASIRYNEGP